METIDGQAPAAAPIETAPAPPAPEPVAVPAAAPAPVAETPTSDLPTDPAAIDAFFRDGAPLNVGGSAVEAGAGTPVPEPAAAVIAAPQTPEADARILPGRISTAQFEPEAQRAMDLQHTLNNGRKPGDAGFVTLKACLEQIASNDSTTAPAAVPAIPQPSRVETITQQADTLKTTIKELREKRLALDETLDSEELASVDAQLETAQEQLIDQRLELKLAEREDQHAQAQAQQSANQTRQQKLDTAKAAALARFPSAGERSTPLGSKVAQLVEEMKNPAHEDHALLFTANAARFISETAAEQVAQEMAQQKGISYADAYASLLAPASAVRPPAAAPEPRRVLPASGANATPPPAAAKTEAQILAEVGTDPDRAGDILFGGRKQWYIGA